jgi:hypothetical protein
MFKSEYFAGAGSFPGRRTGSTSKSVPVVSATSRGSVPPPVFWRDRLSAPAQF